MIARVVGIVLACLLATAAGCQAPGRAAQRKSAMNQTAGGQFVFESVTVGELTCPVAVWLPVGYDPGRQWPGILFLHGKGESGRDGQRHTTVGLGKAIRRHPERFPAVVVMPQMPAGSRWEGPLLDVALAALDQAVERWSVDPQRVVLTGLSLGGFGTWKLGGRCPQRFRALVPICGGGNPADAPQLARVPIWCFHGDADAVIPVQRSREMVAAVRAAGGQVRYTELPGVGHNSWDAAYNDPQVIAWMLEQCR